MREFLKTSIVFIFCVVCFNITTYSLFADTGLNKYNAVIIGHHVRMREKPTTKAKTLDKVNTGLLVKVLNQSKDREKLTKGNSCDDYGYHWYKIKNAKGKTGWVFGKFLFKINKPAETDSITHKEFTLNKKKYHFAVAYDTSYGPSNDDGSTGCDALYVPFLHKKGAKTVSTIKYDHKKYKAFDLGWKSNLFDDGFLILVSDSEGGSDEMLSMTYAKKKKKFYLHLKIRFQYQDGSSIGDIYIGLIKGKISVIGYKNKREN